MSIINIAVPGRKKQTGLLYSHLVSTDTVLSTVILRDFITERDSVILQTQREHCAFSRY